MKRLILIRHGDAEAAQWNTKDFDRALSTMGIQQSHNVRRWLMHHQIFPSIVLHSSAKRTTQTANAIFNSEYPQVHTKISTEKLYLCSHLAIDDIINVTEATETYDCIAIISHNPGLSDYLNVKTQPPIFQHLSTSGIAVIDFDIQAWSDIYSSVATTIYLNQ